MTTLRRFGYSSRASTACRREAIRAFMDSTGKTPTQVSGSLRGLSNMHRVRNPPVAKALAADSKWVAQQRPRRKKSTSVSSSSSSHSQGVRRKTPRKAPSKRRTR